MTREEAIERFNGIINAMSISIAQSKFYPSKAELNELCDMAIEALMTDIVRCGECRFSEEDYPLRIFPNRTEEQARQRWCDHSTYSHDKDFFCGYGERKDNSYGERAEQTEYKLPGHDEVMEALDKLQIKYKTKEDEQVISKLNDSNCQHGRLIDADALMEKIYDSTYPLYSRQFDGYVIPMSRLEEIINNAPTVQAVPRSLYENLLLRKDRPHGEWLKIDTYFEAFNETVTNYKCSVCEFEPYFGGHIERYKYCPNCGAQMDMRGESEGK